MEFGIVLEGYNSSPVNNGAQYTSVRIPVSLQSRYSKAVALGKSSASTIIDRFISLSTNQQNAINRLLLDLQREDREALNEHLKCLPDGYEGPTLLAAEMLKRRGRILPLLGSLPHVRPWSTTECDMMIIVARYRGVVDANSDSPEEAKKPIKFKDAVGRKFLFPFEAVNTWHV